MSETAEYDTILGKREAVREHGFWRTENHTIMSGRVIRWHEERPDTQRDYLEVSASRDGVMLQGYSRHIRDVTELKAVLDAAQKEHERLKACNGRPD